MQSYLVCMNYRAIDDENFRNLFRKLIVLRVACVNCPSAL